MTDYFATFGLDTTKFGQYKTEINKAAEDGVITKDELTGTGLSDAEIDEIINSSKDVESAIDKNADIDVDDADLQLVQDKEVNIATNPTDNKGFQNVNVPTVGGDVNEVDVENLTAQKEALTAALEELSGQKDVATNKLNSAQSKLETLIKEYDNACAKLEKTEKEYQEKQAELEALNEDIIKTQEEETNDFNDEVNNTTSKAIQEYNPEEHGDFDSYLDDIISGLTYSDAELQSLNGEAKDLATELNSIAGNIKTAAKDVRSLQVSVANQKDVVTGLSDEVNDINAQIDVKNTALSAINQQFKILTGEGLTGDEVLAAVSEAEKDLVKANNIDLTEKYEDGSPRYVFAKGKDNQFHIYEMDRSGTRGTSLARQYGNDTGALRGSDVVPSGSGYMNGIKDAGEGQGRAVYSFDSVDDCLTTGCASSENKCYCTSSPLTFDIDGDGIQMNSEIMQYDIDGDGQLDNINNSNDWVLAFDKDGDGISGEDGSELFGDNTDLDGDGKADGFANGFEALKALAQKEGMIGENDSQLDENDLKTLQDKYGLVMTKGYNGEASSLTDLGITNINIAQTTETTLTKNFDGQNNDIMTQEGATFTVNGQTREYADVWNVKRDANGNPIEVKDSDSTKAVEKNSDAKVQNIVDLNMETAYTDEEVEKMLNFADAVNFDNEANEGFVDFEDMLSESLAYGKDVGEEIEEDFEKQLEEQQEVENKEPKNSTNTKDVSSKQENDNLIFENTDFDSMDLDLENEDVNKFQKKKIK